MKMLVHMEQIPICVPSYTAMCKCDFFVPRHKGRIARRCYGTDRATTESAASGVTTASPGICRRWAARC